MIDGTEVYYGGSSNNKKRISPSIDAGYVTQSATYNGRSLYRHVDEEATQEAGYEVLVDTNNSSTDFYEREKQSLHEWDEENIYNRPLDPMSDIRSFGADLWHHRTA